MKSNNVYNLMTQITQESKSLWRIQDQYIKDAEGSEDCTAFWEKMVRDKKEHILALEELIKKSLS